MIYQIHPAIKSRAATMENPHGLPGAGGTASGGRKGAPALSPFPAGHTHTLLDAEGPGVVRHIWLTVPPGDPRIMRNLIVRMYWDGSAIPAVEAPLLDFFGLSHGRARHLVCERFYVQDARGFNCWFPMPFARHARIEIHNDSELEVKMLFYQVDYSIGDHVTEHDGYFHARFTRNNPCPMGEDFVICETQGCGQYVGTVLGVRSLFTGCWWGEGEVKAYIDGDTTLPTICGTGAEDYMGSAWGLGEVQTPLQGAPLVDNTLGLYSLYRLHTQDPVRFTQKLKLTIQQIGFGPIDTAAAHYGQDFHQYHACGNPPERRMCYFERSDDYSAVAYWYQQGTSTPTRPFPDREARTADLSIEQAMGDVTRQDI